MSYATLRNKKAELIRKARDGSVFIAPASADGITSLTSGTPTNEIQSVTITGTPTGGTFTLTFQGQTTTAIVYNAASSAVESALEALAALAPADVSVTGSAGGPYTVTFAGAYAATNVPAMTATASFTGGTTPGVTIATPTPGTGVDLAALPSGWDDLGWISSDGVTYGRETEVSDVTSFGSVEPTRSDVTRDAITLQVVAQETKMLTLGLYTGADTSALKADAVTGEFVISKPSIPGFRFYRVLGIFEDRDDTGLPIWIGRYMPRARITEWGEQQFTDGDDPISYSFTFTGFEDSTAGFSHQWLYGGPGWQALLSSMGIPTT